MEVLQDRCTESFVVVDNSGSMEHEDATIYSKNYNGVYNKIDNVSRWNEAIHKTLEIAQYNIARKMKTSYYLLNPNIKGQWELNLDYIVLDPYSRFINNDLKILETYILSDRNIRGNTPLDGITNYFSGLFDKNFYNENKAICLNIITDGEPNNSDTFTNSLKLIAKSHSVFLVINLCTDDDNVVEYYNKLDTTIGNELSGLDVIDDFESEAKEIKKVKNTFFVYSYRIHLCRQAGCYSIISDQMDEITFPIHYITKFIRELFKQEKPKIVEGKLINNQLNALNPSKYLGRIDKLIQDSELVYNILTHSFEKPIDISKLKWFIWKNYILYKISNICS